MEADKWSNDEMQAHVAEFLRLLATDEAGANLYFETHLFAPFDSVLTAFYYKHPTLQLGDVQDFKQKSFVHVLRYLNHFDGTKGKTLFSWVWGITRQRALNMHRDALKRVAIPLATVSEDDASAGLEVCYGNENSEAAIAHLEDMHEWFLEFWTEDRLREHFKGYALRVASRIVLLVGTPEVQSRIISRFVHPRGRTVDTVRKMASISAGAFAAKSRSSVQV